MNGAFGAQEGNYSEYTPRQATNELDIRNNNVRMPLEGLGDRLTFPRLLFLTTLFFKKCIYNELFNVEWSIWSTRVYL
jgi:hypothetical protein